jgi:hypothetical protein
MIKHLLSNNGGGKPMVELSSGSLHIKLLPAVWLTNSSDGARTKAQLARDACIGLVQVTGARCLDRQKPRPYKTPISIKTVKI